MKNDDAALVKEMKSGRERERERKAEGWKTERSTEGVYCLRSRSVEQKGIRSNSTWQRNNSRPALRNDPFPLRLLHPPSFRGQAFFVKPFECLVHVNRFSTIENSFDRLVVKKNPPRDALHFQSTSDRGVKTGRRRGREAISRKTIT